MHDFDDGGFDGPGMGLMLESLHAAGVDGGLYEADDLHIDAPGPASSGEPALDLRGLPAPEPLLRALAAVDALEAGEALVVLTPALPLPLLDELARRGLPFEAERLPDGARVRIGRP